MSSETKTRKFHVSAPGATTERARYLVAYHLAMAAAYFELAEGDDRTPAILLEREVEEMMESRGVPQQGRDRDPGPALGAAYAWLDEIRASYRAGDEPNGDDYAQRADKSI